MDFLFGFLVAVVISLTGVGAGTLTTPILILFLHQSPGSAVGTALAFATIVRMVIAPVQIARKQVNYRVLGFLLIGGVPGVLIGSLFFRYIVRRSDWSGLYWVLGSIIIVASTMQIVKYFRPLQAPGVRRERLGLLAALMFPIGAEVGLSSSGAGALGSVALLSLTDMPASQLVGTDVVFGLCLSFIGSGIHFAGGMFAAPLLIRMAAGGILGAFAGCSLAPRLPHREMRLALSLFLLVIGINFMFRAASM